MWTVGKLTTITSVCAMWMLGVGYFNWHFSGSPPSQAASNSTLPIVGGTLALDFDPAKEQYGVAIAPPGIDPEAKNSSLSQSVTVVSPVSGIVGLKGNGIHGLGEYLTIRTTLDDIESDVTIAKFTQATIEIGEVVEPGTPIAVLQESTGLANFPQIWIQVADADNVHSLRDPARIGAIRALEAAN